MRPIVLEVVSNAHAPSVNLTSATFSREQRFTFDFFCAVTRGRAPDTGLGRRRRRGGDGNNPANSDPTQLSNPSDLCLLGAVPQPSPAGGGV